MTYSKAEVFRTAHKYMRQNTGFGEGLPHGINQVCICCKASSSIGDGNTVGHVEKITDLAELRPWTDFYTSGANEWAAYRCLTCGYMWSWYRPVLEEVAA